MSAETLAVARQSEHSLDVAEQRERLPELVEAGDAEELARIAHMAELVQLHEKVTKNKAAADEAGRLKVEAEAGIGVIDIKLNPSQAGSSGPYREPLVIGSAEVVHPKRTAWRRLGYADLQGLLGQAVDTVVGNSMGGVTTSSVAEVALELGAGRWRTQELIRAWKQSGLTGTEVARRSALPPPTVRGYLSGRKKSVGFREGLLMASALGIADCDLRPSKRTVRRYVEDVDVRRSRARNWARLRLWKARDEAVRARGGKVAEIYALVRRAEQMSTGARDTLENRDAKAELDSAVLDLMEAAAKLHRAALLG